MKQWCLEGGRQAIVLIGLQGVGRVGVPRQVAAEARGVKDGLTGTVGAHRVHRVSGVAQLVSVVPAVSPSPVG